MKFKFGCDPEIFLQDNTGKIRSAIDTFGGTKEFPRALPLGEGFFVQEDNVALEFNIPPCDSNKELLTNMHKAVDFLATQAAEIYGLYFNNNSALSFPEDELVDPRALTFGCEPDFNAWTGKVNRKPKAADPTLRSAGGHIHVGFDVESKADRLRMGRLMDLHLGIPSVVMDTGEVRKQLYGKAGAMRYKPFGIEYRVLSNFWIFNSKLVTWAWDATDRAVQDFAAGKDIMELEEIVVNTINDSNKASAASMIAEFGLCHA